MTNTDRDSTDQSRAPGGLTDALRKIDKALEVVHELCDGSRRWVMSVPARDEDDPDLVIAGALSAARALLSSGASPLIEPTQERYGLLLDLVAQFNDPDPDLVARLAMIDATGSSRENGETWHRVGMAGAANVLGELADILQDTADSIAPLPSTPSVQPISDEKKGQL